MKIGLFVVCSLETGRPSEVATGTQDIVSFPSIPNPDSFLAGNFIVFAVSTGRLQVA